MSRRDFFHTGLNVSRSDLKRMKNATSFVIPEGDEYYVNVNATQNGNGLSEDTPFTTITEALTKATGRNDVINVAPGDYDEGAVLNITTQGLTIRSWNPAGDVQNRAMIYDGSSAGYHLMTINAHEVTIDGIAFSACADTYDAIRVATTAAAYKVTLKNIRFDGWSGEYGVYVGDTYDAPDLVIEDCLFRSWNTACIRTNTTRAMIRRNNMLLVASKAGIVHVPNGGNRPDTTIEDNNIYGVNSSDTGISLSNTPTESTLNITGNRVINCATPITLSKYTSWYEGNYWGREDWRYHPGDGREAAIARGADGNIFYVDLNIATTGLDGRCWASAFATVAAGLAAADTDVGSNRNWARRNTVYVIGDGITETLVLAAEKTDLVGLGTDVSSFPKITGNFTIGTAVPGFRIFNMGFVPTTTAPIITFPSGMHGWELHNVHLYKTDTLLNSASILSTDSRDFVMKDTYLYTAIDGTKNTIGLNIAGTTNGMGRALIDNCFIAGVEAFNVVDTSAFIEGAVCKNTTFYATNLCIDENSDSMAFIDNRLITAANSGSGAGSGIVDWNAALVCGNEATSGDHNGPLPVLSGHA